MNKLYSIIYISQNINQNFKADKQKPSQEEAEAEQIKSINYKTIKFIKPFFIVIL
jgi:hypothetical protein